MGILLLGASKLPTISVGLLTATLFSLGEDLWTQEAEWGIAKMAQGFWKVYKAKVLQTLGGEPEEDDLQDEVETVSTRPTSLPMKHGIVA